MCISVSETFFSLQMPCVCLQHFYKKHSWQVGVMNTLNYFVIVKKKLIYLVSRKAFEHVIERYLKFKVNL